MWHHLPAALLLGAVHLAFADEQNQFFRPTNTDHFAKDGNEVWPVGSIQSVQWTTTNDSYTVSLWQQTIREGDIPILWKDLYTADGDGAGNHSFDWTVELYGADLQHSNLFFFWIEQGDHKDPIVASLGFNITQTGDQGTGSTTSSSSSSASAASANTASSSVTSGGTASASGAVTSSTSSGSSAKSTSTPSGTTAGAASAASASAANASASSTQPAPSSNKSATKIGLGVGLGVGIPLILLLAGILFFLVRRRRPSGDSKGGYAAAHQNPGPYEAPTQDIAQLSGHGVAEKEAPAPRYEMYDGRSAAVHEAPGHEAVELPGAKQ